MLKFNLGAGNNFILKNSNIVITQNAVSKGLPYNINNSLPIDRDQSLAIDQQDKTKKKFANAGAHSRSYSYEQKAKIYQAKAPKYNTFVPNTQNLTFSQ